MKYKGAIFANFRPRLKPPKITLKSGSGVEDYYLRQIEECCKRLDREDRRRSLGKIFAAMIVVAIVSAFVFVSFGEAKNDGNLRKEVSGDIRRQKESVSSTSTKPVEKIDEEMEKAEQEIEAAKIAIIESEDFIETLEIEIPNKVVVLMDQAREHLEVAEEAFAGGQYGEAYGLANAAEMLARNAIKNLEQLNADEEEDGETTAAISEANDDEKHHEKEGDDEDDADDKKHGKIEDDEEQEVQIDLVQEIEMEIIPSVDEADESELAAEIEADDTTDDLATDEDVETDVAAENDIPVDTATEEVSLDPPEENAEALEEEILPLPVMEYNNSSLSIWYLLVPPDLGPTCGDPWIHTYVLNTSGENLYDVDFKQLIPSDLKQFPSVDTNARVLRYKEKTVVRESSDTMSSVYSFPSASLHEYSTYKYSKTLTVGENTVTTTYVYYFSNGQTYEITYTRENPYVQSTSFKTTWRENEEIKAYDSGSTYVSVNTTGREGTSENTQTVISEYSQKDNRVTVRVTYRNSSVDNYVQRYYTVGETGSSDGTSASTVYLGPRDMIRSLIRVVPADEIDPTKDYSINTEVDFKDKDGKVYTAVDKAAWKEPFVTFSSIDAPYLGTGTIDRWAFLYHRMMYDFPLPGSYIGTGETVTYNEILPADVLDTEIVDDFEETVHMILEVDNEIVVEDSLPEENSVTPT